MILNLTFAVGLKWATARWRILWESKRRKKENEELLLHLTLLRFSIRVSRGTRIRQVSSIERLKLKSLFIVFLKERT